MAGWFTHLLIALRALEKLPKSKHTLLSKPEHFDDYLFGSVAPDARYVTDAKRRITHEPKGNHSAFEAFNSPTPFVAGYESHLIADEKWKAIVDFFRIDTNKYEQKLALYFAIDRYFQEKSGWFLPILFSGNVYRANDIALLESLGFNKGQISRYKLLVSGYLLRPDFGKFISFVTKFPLPVNEEILVKVLDALTVPRKKLNNYLRESVSSSVKAIVKNL